MNIIEPLKPFAVPIDSVYCDTENANTEHDIEGIMQSLKDLGQDTPLVCRKSDNVICSGNGRLIAAKRLGWTEVAAVFVDDDKAAFIKRAVAHNLLNRKSHFDDSVLKSLLSSLDEPLEVPGIDAEFLASLDRIDYTLPGNIGEEGEGSAAGESGKSGGGLNTVYFMLNDDDYHRFKQLRGDMSDNEWFLQALERF